ncbi:sulfite exporter TauE/SafE family protein [Putridiphycobacter roseus]|uniref:Probable membrane transporter protein n=1 Tax=Putridiphycobacter roseus TaxID=2219161 RepID=A0A2W1N1N4_9FLAO|nr:sulfite exporter TauE/SafE family protein [Putridiphycobacter roseus]PZE18187.1 sulfite exporter TauE/SafE family protein [Putridiphycobacter roseus]
MEIFDYFVLVIVAFSASWLTFFSGFGLGTLMTPVFFFLLKDLTMAIAATAIVHLTNNIFKFILMKKSVNWQIVIPFGLAAIPAAVLGAYLTSHFTDVTLYNYHLGDGSYDIQLINLIFGIILIGFALIELIPKWSIVFAKQSLWLGGAISGFFGGLSGHQGALRTAFLIRYKLSKEAFIASGIVIALIIDLARTPIYFTNFELNGLKDQWLIIVIAIGSAITGAIIGKIFLKKVAFNLLTILISIGMIIFGLALIGGFLEK